MTVGNVAVLHRADLRPTKVEALRRWLPRQPWSALTDGSEVVEVGRFRFDDPAGEVGVETLLVSTTGGPVLQAPLTYRGAPLEGAQEHLVTTMDHSVLGRRWVYDAVADPVYADVLHRAVATGGTDADLQVEVDGRLEPAAKHAGARGSGSAASAPTIREVRASTSGALTTISTAVGDLVVIRVLGTPAPAGETLTAAWSGGPPFLLAVLAG
ncbi:CG0192-related protein [Kineococcus sp. SYSU DK003]|uniref:CG0192-related protein n=1 Tax=Kineococcus sp. SYSU DK003 TaxID=3383124 RepID=UPI003D7ED493